MSKHSLDPFSSARNLVFSGRARCSRERSRPFPTCGSQAGAAPQAAPARTGTASATNAPGETQPPRGEGLGAVRGHRRHGDRRSCAVPMWERNWPGRAVFPFEFVIMLGDNIYGSERPQDYVRKFELPYKAILDAKFCSTRRSATTTIPTSSSTSRSTWTASAITPSRRKGARFFALDSNYMDADQWNGWNASSKGLATRWKIAFFHHPLYSSGGRHGSEMDLRAQLEPLFLKYG